MSLTMSVCKPVHCMCG